MIEPLYRTVIMRRNRRFDERRGVVEFDRPVISIGNLTVGGTGKTPMVAWLVGELLASGHRPCIAMRGYGSRGGVEGSDEAAAYRRQFAEVPIVAQADRTSGLLELLAREFADGRDGPGTRIDAIVLDDGFQHRRIARQMDVVLIDASRHTFRDRLLPSGWLREPPESLRRSTHVVVTHAERVESGDLAEIDDRVRSMRGIAPDAVCEHAWQDLDVARGAESVRESVDWLRGRRVLACCAIGNPEPFVAAVRSAAGEVDALVLGDHDPFHQSTITRLIDRTKRWSAEAIVCTDKDWSKLVRSSVTWPCPVVRPRLVLRFRSGRDGLRDAALRLVRDWQPSNMPPQ
jgi:tetraacyldisaccharide 4'-kinase